MFGVPFLTKLLQFVFCVQNCRRKVNVTQIAAPRLSASTTYFRAARTRCTMHCCTVLSQLFTESTHEWAPVGVRIMQRRSAERLRIAMCRVDETPIITPHLIRVNSTRRFDTQESMKRRGYRPGQPYIIHSSGHDRRGEREFDSRLRIDTRECLQSM